MQVVGRPGGGGESDAAFTPSPPVVAPDTSPCVATLTLAHQNRIRTLYSGGNDPPTDTPGAVQPNSYHRRPDSSSSASSATDWEGSGHATVLRRAGQIHPLPPLPPPRQAPAPPLPPPIVDSLHPLPPAGLYNTVSNLAAAAGFESQSSDSDFGGTCPPSKAPYKNARTSAVVPTYHNTSTLKLSSTSSGNTNSNNNVNTSTVSPSVIDRLSVRTELCSLGPAGSRKGIALNSSEENKDSRLHYFPPENGGGADISPPEAPDVISSSNPSGSNSIQDQIIATQLRRLNRELTPTISDVYHERSIGLGLAPPLSKLLRPQGNSKEIDGGGSEALLDKLGLLPDESGNKSSEGKSWLSSSALQQFGEPELDSKQQGGGSPCSELSRRDEGDGRSIADSQCSAGSYNKPLRTSSAAVVYFSADSGDGKSNQGTPPRVVSFLEDSDRQDETKPPLRIPGSAPVPPCPRTRASKQPPPPIPNSRTATAPPTKKFPSQC